MEEENDNLGVDNLLHLRGIEGLDGVDGDDGIEDDDNEQYDDDDDNDDCRDDEDDDEAVVTWAFLMLSLGSMLFKRPDFECFFEGFFWELQLQEGGGVRGGSVVWDKGCFGVPG